jgi:hypothetical protein
MNEIIFHCPVNGTGVTSGIVTDFSSVELMAREEISLRCPHCGIHTWKFGDGRLNKRSSLS